MKQGQRQRQTHTYTDSNLLTTHPSTENDMEKEMKGEKGHVTIAIPYLLPFHFVRDLREDRDAMIYYVHGVLHALPQGSF